MFYCMIFSLSLSDKIEIIQFFCNLLYWNHSFTPEEKGPPQMFSRILNTPVKSFFAEYLLQRIFAIFILGCLYFPVFNDSGKIIGN